MRYSQANTKEMFEDDDLDVSSGSDFDDDEDPDKIEVPGNLIEIRYGFIAFCLVIFGNLLKKSSNRFTNFLREIFKS